MKTRPTPRRQNDRAQWTPADRKAVAVALVVSLIATVAVVALGIVNREPSADTAMLSPVDTAPPAAPEAALDPEPPEPPATPVVEPTPAPNSATVTAANTQVARANEAGTITIRPTDNVILKDVTRFGLNVGARSVYGAAQHLKNILPNPGFESGVFASMIHVAKGADTARVPQAFWDTDWTRDDYGIGQPAGFWDGGEYEFLYGAAKGRTGRITRFAHERNQNVFYLDGGGQTPAEWDVLVIRRELPGIASGPRMVTDCVVTGDTRPDSPGKQSLRITPGDDGKFVLYLDSEWRDGDATAGKLLRIHGEWKLALWAKSAKGPARIRIHFAREGETTFVDEIVSVTNEWQLIERSFSVADDADKLGPYDKDAYRPLLTFSIGVENDGGEVLLDDATLAPSANKYPIAFTDAFVDRLKELRPGVLRNWSAQHGDTLDNQLSEPFARKTNAYSPKQRVAGEWGFSLHEFLELCHESGAEPWYVMPPTWTATEVRQLMDYLGAPADGQHPYADRRAKLGQQAPWTEVFKRIHLEFGNEMWGDASANDPFFGASALGGDRLGSMANDRYALLSESRFFTKEKINLIIGGQFYYPGRQAEIDKTGPHHREI
ncbi:MAG TPA: hypothetical protein PK869_14795, partial [Candidatus Hydrogenedentes bacterium]|nr:hypothetical protein [Candidatus Hydrogenedentota bacterium]